MTREEEINKHMRVLGLTRTEAEQLYEEDNSNEVSAEVAEMEKKAKALKRRYEGDKTTRKQAERKPRDEPDKKNIMMLLVSALKSGCYEDVTMINEQREIEFWQGESHYSVTLTKHRQAKKK